MRSAIHLLASVALGATSAFAQTPAPAPNNTAMPLQLEIGIRGYAADGRERVHAVDSASGKVDGYVWADKSMCGVGSTSTMPTTTPWVGWHFVGTVQPKAQAEGLSAITFQLDWQRLWQNGARVTDGQKGQSSSTLREGERLELDRVVGTPTEGCNVTQVRLEVGVAGLTASEREFFFFNRAGGVGRGAGAGAGMGVGAKPGVGWTTGTVTSGNWVLLPKDAAFGTKYRDVLESMKAKPFSKLEPIGSFDAELWLVHRLPDGTETTQQQTVRFTHVDKTFTFPAVVVPTAKGDVTLDISGALYAATPADALERSSFFQRNDTSVLRWTRGFGPMVKNGADVGVALSIARRARATGTTALDTRGGSYFFMDMPPATEVLSFEFPALPVAEDLLKGHTFSLRIRVKPVDK